MQTYEGCGMKREWWKGMKKGATQPLDRCADTWTGVIEPAECTLGMCLLLDVGSLRSQKSLGYFITYMFHICM